MNEQILQKLQQLYNTIFNLNIDNWDVQATIDRGVALGLIVEVEVLLLESKK